MSKLIERIEKWQDRDAVCDVFDKGYTDRRTETDTALYVAGELFITVHKALESKDAEIERLKADLAAKHEWCVNTDLENASMKAVVDAVTGGIPSEITAALAKLEEST